MFRDIGRVQSETGRLRVDRTVGAAGRRCASIGHVDTGMLWIQRAVAEERIVLKKSVWSDAPRRCRYRSAWAWRRSCSRHLSHEQDSNAWEHERSRREP